MIFEFRDVTKKKTNQNRNSSSSHEYILKSVSLSVVENQPFLILGPSGSGKSTLLRHFNRLIDPDDGVILFNGVDIKNYDVIQLRSTVGFVGQVPVMFEGSVYDNLTFFFKYSRGKHFDAENLKIKCRNLLKMMNLNTQILEQSASQLSVGEQQRVALARTMIKEPDVILLDEPASSLDPTATAKFLDIIKYLQETEKVSIVLVTHSIDQAKKIGGKGILLINGEVIEESSIDDLLVNTSKPIIKKFLEGQLDN